MTIYHKVISLGPNCQTAFQIRQLIEQEEAYPFDWVIASPSAVVKAVETKFQKFVNPDGLVLRSSGAPESHPYVYDKVSDIEFHHDFENSENFMNSVEHVKSKYKFLTSRMLRQLQAREPILFVHHTGQWQDAMEFAQAISANFPQLPFDVLDVAISKSKVKARHGNVIRMSIDGSGETWQDRTPQWAEVFDDILADSFLGPMRRKAL